MHLPTEPKTPTRYITGIGQPILDLTVTVTPEYLENYQLNPNGQTLCEQSKNHQKIYQDLLNIKDVKYTAGGTTLNSLTAAAWLLKSQKQYLENPQKPMFAGSVAKDIFGKMLGDARENMLDLHWNVIGREDIELKNSDDQKKALESMVDENNNLGSAVCAVLLSDGGKNRSLVTNLGAARFFSLEAFENVENDVLDTKIVYISGFFLKTFGGPEIIKTIGNKLNSSQIMAANLSAPFLAVYKKSELDMTISYASFVIGNSEEAHSWAASHNLPKNASLEEIAEKIARMPILRKNMEDLNIFSEKDQSETERIQRVVVVTQGGDDTIFAIYRDGGVIDNKGDVEVLKSGNLSGSVEIRRFKTRKVENIVDTNCAGDTFAGAFLASLSLGKSIDDSVAAANYSASIVIQHHGCSFPEVCDFQFE